MCSAERERRVHEPDAKVEIMRPAIENPAEPGVFADDVVWHFTGRVPGLASDDRGREALLSEFLGRPMALTGESVPVKALDVRAAGEELVVAHLRISMTVDGTTRAGRDVVVYRVIDGKVAEAFDIPAVDIGGSHRRRR